MQIQSANPRRFDRVAISSVLGSPDSPSVWSAAPYNLANALERLGVSVVRINAGLNRIELGLLALRYAAEGYGLPPSTEAVLRSPAARLITARRLTEKLRGTGVDGVIHTGTLDMHTRAADTSLSHYLYCDDDWTFSLPNRPDAHRYGSASVRAFALEDRTALANVAHVFTFSRCLRDHFAAHFGLSPQRVSAVGCGMGTIEPYSGRKDYASGRILFVAKHLFVQKGGLLLLEAFRIARETRSDITLSIVGDRRSRRFAAGQDGVEVHDRLSWTELQEMYRRAALLVQPMLNDPWGQVFVEALASRTPVVGLRRNGLPEIIEDGRHGFLVDEPDPRQIARTMLDALSHPERLAEMGSSGQQHVLRNYTWDLVARRIAYGVTSADHDSNSISLDSHRQPDRTRPCPIVSH